MKISKIEARPYILENSIQNYAWGTKGEEALIPKLVGAEIEEGVPYAELWIGAHPKAPSFILIDNEKYGLDELIKQFPDEILGKHIIEKFGAKLPYLLKVLSINQALSIQVHPSKELAKTLHERDPKNYPDDNHKPEIAIAIDNLRAIVGFKPLEEIRLILQSYPSLANLAGNNVNALFSEANEISANELLKKFYSSIMSTSEGELAVCINDIKKQIESKNEHTDEEKQFLLQYENYGVDAGLISILIFNMVNLNPGEAIFTKDGVPHAYIKGNIVECMANSDNVVRAGLTPKFKDVETLLNMLTYEGVKPEIILPEGKSEVLYNTPASEFRLTKYTSENNELIEFTDNDELIIGFVLKGNISVKSEELDSLELKRGMACLIPALLKDFKFNLKSKTTFILVKVPKN